MRIAKIPAARTLREVAAEGREMADLRRRKTERRGGDAGIGGDDALIGADGGHRGGGADAKCAVRAPFDGCKLGQNGDIDQRAFRDAAAAAFGNVGAGGAEFGGRDGS